MISVFLRSRNLSCDNPLRYVSPASVTFVQETSRTSKLSQAFQVLQPDVGDLGAAEQQHVDLVQSLEVFQPGIRNLGAPEVQRLESSQSFEVFQPGVGDLGALEVQRLESSQSFEVFQPGVGDLGAVRGSASGVGSIL